MTDLRYTDANASDDSVGRVFGLDGDLYLPLVVAAIGAIGLFAVLAFALRAGFALAGVVAACPLATVLVWAFGLRHGKPTGYDRERIEEWLGGGDFSRAAKDQEGLV